MSASYYFLFIGAVILFWLLISSNAINKIIRINRKHLPNISDLPNNSLVVAIGITEKKHLKSPVNRLPCVAWQLEVQEMTKKVMPSEHSQMLGYYDYKWKTIGKSTSVDPFTIIDNTDSLLIQLSSAKMILNTQIYIPEPNIETINLLDKYLGSTILDVTTRSLVVYERFIPPQKQLYVIGKINQFDKTISINQRQMIAEVISDRLDCLKEPLTKQLIINIGYAIAIIFFGSLYYITSLLRN